MDAMHIDHQQLTRALGDALVVADGEGRIVLWNRAATRIFGFAEDEALGRPLDLIIPERQRARHNEGYAQTVASGTTRYGSRLLQVPALHKDGRRLSIAFTVTLLTAADGQVRGVAAVVRDETERFAQEQQLRRQVAELQAAQRPATTD